MNLKTILAAGVASSFLVFASADAQSGIELGQLNCEVEGGAGFIFGSSKNLACTFTSANDEIPSETYYGEINKYGIDIGVTGKTIIAWTVVMAEDRKYAPGALSGTYSGATANAAFAVGLGANVLVGGSDSTFALQPVSVAASEGVNVAVGFAQVILRQ